jgi:gamma-glutamyltranspeptidase/glutathione hydrolase
MMTRRYRVRASLCAVFLTAAFTAAAAGQQVRSRAGMVVTGVALASAAGAGVLAEGGNAVDAAVAAAFALAVVEPSMSGLGGRTQILLRTASGDVAAIDGTTEVPASYPGGPENDDDAWGIGTIAVPGTVAALDAALRQYGTWPLERVMRPAIALAEDGFSLPGPEATRIAAAADRLREFEGGSHFLKADGSPYSAGDRFRQPALAATLRAIASEGADSFYRGRLAAIMADELAAAGAWVTAVDLAAYRAEASPVVRGSYRGHELIGSYLPASGATTIEILQVLDHFDMPRLVGSVEWARVLYHALLAGFDDRVAPINGPASGKAAWLTSDSLAARRAAEIRSRLREAAARAPEGRADTPEPEHTTHLSVADRDGNVVALTQSLGPSMGSKVASPTLGFLYAATMQYLGALEPDTRRHWSSQSPMIVLHDDRPAFVLGGAGGRRIIPGIVMTLSRAIDGRLPLDQALAAPRLHATPDRIDVETRPASSWTAPQVDSLRALGPTVRARDDAPYFARINAIAFDDRTGEWVGVPDPRWQGVAMAPPPRRASAGGERRLAVPPDLGLSRGTASGFASGQRIHSPADRPCPLDRSPSIRGANAHLAFRASSPRPARRTLKRPDTALSGRCRLDPGQHLLVKGVRGQVEAAGPGYRPRFLVDEHCSEEVLIVPYREHTPPDQMSEGYLPFRAILEPDPHMVVGSSLNCYNAIEHFPYSSGAILDSGCICSA